MHIRFASKQDVSRIAEIYVFNNRMNFFPIFQDESYSFKELQVISMMDYFKKPDVLNHLIVYDDGIIKGFIQINDSEIVKLYVDTFFQSKEIGTYLLAYAIEKYHVDHLWVLEKNKRATAFYEKHGFHQSGKKKFEEDTTEYLLQYIRN